MIGFTHRSFLRSGLNASGSRFVDGFVAFVGEFVSDLVDGCCLRLLVQELDIIYKLFVSESVKADECFLPVRVKLFLRSEFSLRLFDISIKRAFELSFEPVVGSNGSGVKRVVDILKLSDFLFQFLNAVCSMQTNKVV